MTAPGLDGWLAAARRAAQQPPAQPRQTLVVAGQVVGSVAPDFLNKICLQRLLDKRKQLLNQEYGGAPAWQLDVPPEAATDALNTLAAALRDADLCGPWRNEQLAVQAVDGSRIGTVERGAVRVLGIATEAVHLVGVAPGGDLWVQQRAADKANYPLHWDTLMGGMVSAADDLPQALARETWEEAGLRLDQLQALTYGGCVGFRRPSGGDGNEQDIGYTVEDIDWFHAVLPDGVVPQNQDGEVEQFVLLERAALSSMLEQGLFTLEAALVIAAFQGLEGA